MGSSNQNHQGLVSRRSVQTECTGGGFDLSAMYAPGPGTCSSANRWVSFGMDYRVSFVQATFAGEPLGRAQHDRGELRAIIGTITLVSRERRTRAINSLRIVGGTAGEGNSGADVPRAEPTAKVRRHLPNYRLPRETRGGLAVEYPSLGHITVQRTIALVRAHLA